MSRAVVDRGPALRRLLDVRSRRYLYPFIGRERSVAEAADDAGTSLAAMWYQARRMLESGILVQTSVTQRRGRPVRRYRSSADEYVLPLTAMGDEPLQTMIARAEAVAREALHRGLVDALLRAHIPAESIVLRIRRLSRGAIDASPAFYDGSRLRPLRPRGSWSSWTSIALSQREADELQRELTELWRRWSERSAGPVPSGPVYLLRLALAPQRPNPRA